MKYKYNRNSGQFYPGIPARDIDENDIPDEHKDAFKAAVKAGVYTSDKEITNGREPRIEPRITEEKESGGGDAK